MNKRAPIHALTGTLLCMLGACASAELQSPIPTIGYPNHEPARTLVVMLPGAGDRVGVFDEHGFVTAMRDSGMTVDVLEVDAHFGYYKTRTLLERIEQDVLAPNRDKYDELWLVGISLGGFGALLTAWTYPEDVDGMILMAPYMGRRKTLNTISKAGGLEAWQPPATVDREDGWDIELWRMLKQIAEADGVGKPKLYLMYGEDDFGARAHDMLAAALPASQVRRIPGGHAWTTWEALWLAFVQERAI
ncbi:MAG TPA: alpha/beta hydrolase [Enhygromyxa sp.]|nr:alpha/beta hydrolase [Enhygromyxa sp.]